jgi:hypothetical protein
VLALGAARALWRWLTMIRWTQAKSRIACTAANLCAKASFPNAAGMTPMPLATDAVPSVRNSATHATFRQKWKTSMCIDRVYCWSCIVYASQLRRMQSAEVLTARARSQGTGLKSGLCRQMLMYSLTKSRSCRTVVSNSAASLGQTPLTRIPKHAMAASAEAKKRTVFAFSNMRGARLNTGGVR